MFISILILLFLTAIFVPLKLFVLGEPVDGTQLFWNTYAEGNTLTIHFGTSSSAMALRGIKVRQEGSSHYVTPRKVLVSPLFSSGDALVSIDMLKADTVWLGGKLIWSAQ